MKKQLIFTMILIMMAAFGFTQTFEKQGAGVTILVHGWNPDGNEPVWMTSMANAIIARSGGDGQIATITVTGSAGNLTATCTDWDFSMATATSGQIVVLVNWTDVANHLTTFVTAQEVAAAVAPKIYQSQNDQFALSELPIHLIGHSRGGGMVYEIARLLGLQGIDVDHLTSLDPHPLTEADPQPLMGTRTIDTPVALYENVLFADNYYQNIEFPTGQYVTGAYNRLWESLPGGYHNETGYTYNILGINYNFSDHLNIILAYNGTVDLATPTTNGEATMTQSERDAWFNTYEAQGEIEGFYYSADVAGDRKSTDSPVAGGDQIVDGLHDNTLLGGNGARQAQDWTNADWPNILTCDVLINSTVLQAGQQALSLGDEIQIQSNYRSYANASTINVYADLDRNPYNDNKVAINNQNFSATGNTITESSINWTVQDIVVGNTYYIYAEIDDGTHKRYLYSNHEIEVVPTQESPTAGNGSETNPYEIETLENLYWLSQNSVFWDAHYIQTADIDAAETETWFSSEGFPPIGTEAEAFTGIYNGDNYTISNLYINSTSDYVGLFGNVGDNSLEGSLENIVLENASIIAASNSGWFYAGALVGYIIYGDVNNCHSSGTVQGDNDGATGGLIGSVDFNSSVSNSSSSCLVSGIEDVGGFVGDIMYADVTNCKAVGEVAGTAYVGGFTGYILGARINNCFAKGNVSGSEYIGGFVSEIRYSSYLTNITNSYSWGNVTRLTGATDEHIASFIGNCSDNGSTPVEISYSYSIGAVIYEDAANPTDKGFIGMETGTNTYTGNFYDYTTSSQTSGLGASPKLTNVMQTMSTFTDAGWDFMGETSNGENDHWGINQNENNGYPFLKWQGYKLYTEVTENPTAESLQCPTVLENVTLTGGAANTDGSFAFANPADIPPAGTSQHEVIFTPADEENYSTVSIMIDVTVEDNTNPEITSTHEAQTVDANENCEASLPDYTGDLTASDNCSDLASMTVTQTPAASTTISGTTNSVTLKVEDEAGNFAEISFNVEIIDNTNPEITSTHNNQQVDADANCEASLPDYTGDVTATDNCSDFTNMTVTQIPESGTIISGTSNTVTLTVTDEAENFAEVSFNVEVVDNTNPIITCIENQSIDLSEGETFYTVQGAEFDPTSTDDNCDLVSVENDFNNTATLENAQFPVGITTVEWTVTDNAANTATCSFEITVNTLVGIVDLSANGISIYPNPTSGFVYISSYIDKEVFKNVEITDIHGKTISYFQINKSANIQIDISNKPDGIYFLKIHTNDRFFYSKIIKQ